MPSQVLGYPEGFSADIKTGPSAAGTAEEYELRFARRALAKVKERLGIEAIEKLLQPDIDQGEKYWRDIMAKNTAGEFNPSRVELSVKGIQAEEFLKWFHHRCAKHVPSMQASQPEHWVVTVNRDRSQKVIENLGSSITHFCVVFSDPTQSFPKEDLRDDYPIKMTGQGQLDDETIHVYILHQFKNRADGSGFDVDLCTYFPASASDDLLEQHRQHLVVEFTNWTPRHCYSELKVGGVQL